ncbi:MAG TPA: hypothetical protein VFA66_03635 [Gaiellaceae bacterium]|nr:hypothetical protein [Gaiellaceae bacterium]
MPGTGSRPPANPIVKRNHRCQARLCGAAVLLAATLATGAGAAGPKTRVTVYRAFEQGRLAPGLTIARTARGYCWEGSIADQRSDAWRCFIGNVIVDPCFSDRQARGWVACPAEGSPFDRRLIRLRLTKALPKELGNHGTPGTGDPWAVKLADGRECTFLTGATSAYHGRRISYGCTRTVFLAGSPNRRRPAWTIVLGRGQNAPSRTVSIAVAAW